MFRAWRRGVYRALRSTILTDMVMEEVPTSETKKKIGDMGMQWIFSIGPSKPTFYPALCLGEADLCGLLPLAPLSSGSGSDLANRKHRQRSEAGKSRMLGVFIPLSRSLLGVPRLATFLSDVHSSVGLVLSM